MTTARASTAPSEKLAEPLLVIVGPTASGKTELAVRLAELANGEVVSADSVQVYRHFDIGSGKPTLDELARAPHHLIDVVDPAEMLEAARWTELADATIAEIARRGRRPIVCGGTFLWVRALLFGLADAPPGDEALRREHERLASEHGRSHLHQMLAEVDPESAARLHENDFVRVSRALEVHQMTGRKLSELQAEHGFKEARYPHRLIAVRREREALDERIRRRIETMFAQGWVDEVQELLRQQLGETRAMGAVGYRQIREALEADPIPEQGPIPEQELVDVVYRATRVFARRQLTWLRDEPVTWLDPAHLDDETIRTLLV